MEFRGALPLYEELLLQKEFEHMHKDNHKKVHPSGKDTVIVNKMKYQEIPEPIKQAFASTINFDSLSEKERFNTMSNELSKLR
jgi:hypothetical protein